MISGIERDVACDSRLIAKRISLWKWKIVYIKINGFHLQKR